MSSRAPHARGLAVVLALAATALACAPAQAARVIEVRISGLDEAQTANVREALSLQDAVGRSVSDARLDYLLRAAEDEAREALEPFGYYDATVSVRESFGDADDAGQDADAPVAVDIAVRAGEPVRVRERRVEIAGEGADDRYLKEELAAFAPARGEVFDHGVYEAAKTRIVRRLAERGYFDADFTARTVRVTRAERAADIDLRWDSGLRYAMGPVSFTQTPEPVVREALLRELIYWEQGDYYHQGRLDRLAKSLVALDYFSRVDVQPQPEAAVDGEVPVKVELTPAKRSVYTVGLSYGTDSGAGVRLGLERRYLNTRGHKAKLQLDYAQKRKTFTAQHRIPAFAWRDGWYTTSVQLYDEQTDYIDTRRIELAFGRSGQYNRQLQLNAGLHALRERWAFAYSDLARGDARTLYQESTLLYAALRADYNGTDDRIAPRSGFAANAALLGGLRATGSDTDFIQLHLRGSWYRGLGERSRLIVRGEAGYTYTDALVDIPPSLRFFAGGDRSVRGYEWREIGPRIPAAPGRRAYALGAKNVLTASVEYEQYLTPEWGFATFIDGGNAFDGRIDRWRQGVGVGLRWRSPVGPLRLDVARGLDDPDASFTLHLNLGADL